MLGRSRNVPPSICVMLLPSSFLELGTRHEQGFVQIRHGSNKEVSESNPDSPPGYRDVILFALRSLPFGEMRTCHVRS